jgi:CRISPR-associated protein Cmr1
MKTLLKPAPTRAELPARRERTALGDAGQPLVEIRVKLETSTTVMGGSTRTRVVDKAEVIRAASVRGALRFWWRALHSHQYKTPRELFEAEAALWGRAAEESKQGRSAVEVRILDAKPTEIETHQVVLYDGKDGKRDQHAYALFAARGQTKGQTEEERNAAERYKPGITFELLLRAPAGKEDEVRRAVKAWILFGGYGARTRRGVGSLTVRAEHRASWLPTACTASALNAYFGGDKLFGVAGGPRRDVASLIGARLFARADKPLDDAMRAWELAINWLSDFRQKDGPGDDAARGAAVNKRPGRSRWPEADKIRQLTRKHSARHAPLHNAHPVWPRAGFGLPIVGQFIDKDDPGPYTIIWYDRDGNKKDRLASPLIVKAMPLANGKYVPIALWLHRAFPEGGQAGLDDARNPGKAPIDLIQAPGEQNRYSPLNGITGTDQLQQAFFKWLEVKNYASEVR